MFLETCPFLLGCPICWHTAFCNIFLWFFWVFMWYRLLFLLFRYLFIWVLSFFVVSLARGLLILFIFSRNQLLVLLIFSIIIFISILFIFSLIFIIYFLLLTFSFVFFLILLGGRCGSLFEIFLFSWGRPILLWTSLLELPSLHPIDFVSLCFHCLLSWGIFWFPLWLHHWPIGFLITGG